MSSLPALLLNKNRWIPYTSLLLFLDSCSNLCSAFPKKQSMRVHLFLNKKSKVQTILNESESLRVLEISGFQNSLEVTFLQKTKILLITNSFFFF